MGGSVSGPAGCARYGAEHELGIIMICILIEDVIVYIAHPILWIPYLQCFWTDGGYNRLYGYYIFTKKNINCQTVYAAQTIEKPACEGNITQRESSTTL